MEAELDSEQKRHQDTFKEVKKNDRRLKELILQTEEDKKNQTRLQESVDQLQTKMKVYKKQVEDAEEVANANLAKYRKAQHDLEEALERNGQDMTNKQRTKGRSSTVSRDTSPQVKFIKV